MIRHKARRKRSLILAVTAIAWAALVGGPARADSLPQGGGANNVVLAQSVADGSSLVRATTQVTQVGGMSVQSSNIATATATGCFSCHASAVAVQVVMVTGDAQYFLPANAASAVNGGCTACGTFAYAWQYVVQTPRTVSLSPAAQQQVQSLKQQIADTAASIVPDTFDDDVALQAELDALTSQLKDVIDSQLVAAGVHAGAAVTEHVERTPVS